MLFRTISGEADILVRIRALEVSVKSTCQHDLSSCNALREGARVALHLKFEVCGLWFVFQNEFRQSRHFGASFRALEDSVKTTCKHETSSCNALPEGPCVALHFKLEVCGLWFAFQNEFRRSRHFGANFRARSFGQNDMQTRGIKLQCIARGPTRCITS